MISFKTQEQLQEFLMPVLKIRINKLDGSTIKNEQDLFNYLKNIKWKKEKDLYLHEIVEDILHYKIEEQEENNETI